MSIVSTGVVYTGDKFAAIVVDTGGRLPPASLTPVANLLPVSLTPVAKLPPESSTLAKMVANLPLVSLIPVVHP